MLALFKLHKTALFFSFLITLLASCSDSKQRIIDPEDKNPSGSDGGWWNNDTETNADADSDSDTDMDADMDADMDVDIDADADSDSDSDSDGDAGVDACMDSGGLDDSGALDSGCLNPDGGADADSDADADGDASGPDASLDSSCDSGGFPDAGVYMDASPCPSSMVNIKNEFCIDRYEASKMQRIVCGKPVEYAVSVSGNYPWYGTNTVLTFNIAVSGCANAGKRLCTASERIKACKGPDETHFAYGNDYEPTTCNGIDGHCPDGGYTDCWKDFGGWKLEPAGYFENCTNEYGVYDMNGNVWEWSVGDGGAGEAFGGAYNCSQSYEWTKCSFMCDWTGFQVGFRCCTDID